MAGSTTSHPARAGQWRACLLVVAFAGQWYWLYSTTVLTSDTFFSHAANVEALDVVFYLPSLCALGLTFLGVALWARFRPHGPRRAAAVAFGACASAGTLALLAVDSGAGGWLPLVILAGLLTGVGSAGLFLCLCERLCDEPGRRIVLIVSGATGLALTLLFAARPVISGAPALLATAVVPCAIGGLTVLLPAEGGELQPGASATSIKDCLVIGVPLFLYGVSIGALREISVRGVLSIHLPGLLVALLAMAAVALVAMYAVKAAQWPKYLLLVAVSFIAIAEFVPTLGWAPDVTKTAMLVAYAALELTIFLQLAAVAKGLGDSPMFVFGLGFFFSMLGTLFCVVVGSDLVFASDYVVKNVITNPLVLVIVLFFAIVLLPSKHVAPQASGGPGATDPATSTASATSLPAEAPEDEAKRACAEFGGRYGLTQRETEVLFLVYRGKNAAAIAEALYVSPNTVKFHMRNIYKKAGVHNQQAIIREIDGLREGDPATP